ncbi:glycosyltransferase family 4 protein [Clostridiales bacterium FE2011]|nr:glycosyltransferase family 4 protein [Clostridiales bacterium FE2011]
MRILILANLDLGLYKFRKELIEELLNKGHEVFISLPEGDLINALKKMGCIFINTPVDRRGINPITDIKLLIRYKKIMKEVNPELVITYTIKPNIYGGIAARQTGKKYAINITGLGTAFEKPGIVRMVVKMLYKLALQQARIVFFENNSNRNELVSFGCCEKEKTVVLNGAGVNTEIYNYQSYPNNDIIRFLFIGRVMKEKGIEELFQATRRLIEEGEKCFLDVVGPFEENYKEKIDKYEIEGWLKYHGYKEDVRPFIKDCDCFVLPSYHEGMANTNLECASSGRPIITSNIPGCREAVTEQSGIICEPKDINSLYQAMKKIIGMSINQRKQMGICGRQYMEEKFDKKNVIKMTLEKLI